MTPVEATKRRLIWTLFAGNAMGSTAYIGVATVAALIADEITHTTSLAGLPGATSTLGVAIGAAALSLASYRIGRRPAFALGYAGAVIGAAFVAASIATRSFAFLLIGMLAIGVGRSVGQLARYAAGDLRKEERRASAISLIVWASTIGAVVGPLLIGPTGAYAELLGFDELIGPVTVTVIGFALVSILMLIGLRPDPLTLATGTTDGTVGRPDPIGRLLHSRVVQLSIVAIVISQVVMVLVMVMTPIHIDDNGGDLGTVGWVMMAHTLGMFAIAPITGMLIGRFGSKRMIVTAVVTFLVACGIASTATTASTPILIVSMFLLGVAWNFGFVSGSTLLQTDQTIANRLKLQGFADSTAWISSAVAAASSGVILSTSSYRMLSFIGIALALLLVIPLSRLRPLPS